MTLDIALVQLRTLQQYDTVLAHPEFYAAIEVAVESLKAEREQKTQKERAVIPGGAHSETWEITQGYAMDFWLGTCPRCGGFVNEAFRHCSDCGQKLDWEAVRGK